MLSNQSPWHNLNPPVLDINEGTKIFKGDIILALDVLEVLSEEIPNYENGFLKAMRDHNDNEIQFLSEKLHGCIVNCGAPRLRNAALNFDKAIHKHESPVVINDLFVKLLNEMYIFRREWSPVHQMYLFLKLYLLILEMRDNLNK